MKDTCRSSGELTSSTALQAQGSLLDGVLVITDGTNAATVIIYDNASAASGKKLFEAVVAGANNTGYFDLPYAVKAEDGLYVSISGTGASAIVYFG